MSSGDLKVKTHSVSLGFNAPQAPKTKVVIQAHFSGPAIAKLNAELEAKWGSTYVAEKAEVCPFGTSFLKPYVGLRLKLAPGADAAGLAAKFSESLSSFLAVALDPMGIPAKPAFHAEGNDLVGGSVLPIPTQLAEGVKAYLEFLRNMAKRTNHLDQAVKIELNLGASIRDVMFAEESILSQLNKGFEVKVTLSLLSNLRKILLDKLGSSDEQWMPRDV